MEPGQGRSVHRNSRVVTSVEAGDVGDEDYRARL